MRITLATLCVALMAVPAMGVLENAYEVQGTGGQATWEDFDGSYSAIDPAFSTLDSAVTLAPGIFGLPIGTAWSVQANGEWALGLNNTEGTGPNGDDWGGAMSGYNVGNYAGDNDDRNLATYKSSSGDSMAMTMQFINNTGAPITEVTLRYDHEVNWVRFDQLSLRESYLPAYINGQQVTDSMLDNSQVTDAGDVTEWLTDADAEALGLVRRGIGGIFTLATPVVDGATFTLRFHKNYGGYSGADKNMLTGVDNIRLVFTSSEGDANVDGECNLADLSILATFYNYSNDGDETNNDATWGMADFNADGIVNLADLSILATYYNQDVYAAAAAPTPEPATMSLLALGGLALIRRRK